MKTPDFTYRGIKVRDYDNPAEAVSDLVELMIEYMEENNQTPKP